MGLLRIPILVLVLSGYYASAQKKYACDFEDGMCPFLKHSKDNFGGKNWTLGKGTENIGAVGPSIDHTRGDEYGHYMFVDLTASNNPFVELETISLEDDYCLRFFYHMYGAAVPTFKVYTERDGDKTDNTYFVQLRTQGDEWKEAEIYMNPTDGLKNKGYKAVFAVSRLSKTRTKGDVAVDDIEFTPGKCPEKKLEAGNLCTFDYDKCGYQTGARGQWANFIWKNPKEDPRFKKQPMFDHTLSTNYGGYFVTGIDWSTSDNRTDDRSTPGITSPKYPKPESPLNCLHFYVWMDGVEGPTSVSDDLLNVQLNLFDSTQTYLIDRKNVARLYKTQLGKWISVKASANITENFELQFTSFLYINKPENIGASIAIDDIQLLPGDCPEAGPVGFCDFEDDKCTWSDGDEEYSWVRKAGKSRTNGEIGPESDNTKGSPDGSYVVFNALGKDAGAQASLQSQYLPSFNGRPLWLSFFYQMSGTDQGSLKVVRRGPNISESTEWFLSGDQGAIWKERIVKLKHIEQDNQIVFTGTIGNGENGFIALDDIRISIGDYENILPDGFNFRILILVGVVLVILLISSVGCYWCCKSIKNKQNMSSTGVSKVI